MRILIVDDDAGVLQALLAVVRAVPGHEVKVAANAMKAAEHAVAMGGVDLLISDVVMEPVDGFSLRAQLQSSYPEMRTVFVSGYDLSDYSEHLNGAASLQKPVDAMALLTEIGNALGNHSAPAVAAAPEKARVAGKTTAITVPAAASRIVSAKKATTRTVVPAPAAPAAEIPVAIPQPEAAAQPAAPAPAAADYAHDPLLGVQLGDYRVQQCIGEGRWGRVYLALQLSVSRRVGLQVLNPSWADDENARTQFLNDARAKAAVQHQNIMSVFEADESNGLIFYTHEYHDGASMAERIATAQTFDEKTALHVLKVAAESLQYLWSHNLSHEHIEPGSLRLGADGIARMANLAVADSDPTVTVEQELLRGPDRLGDHDSRGPDVHSISGASRSVSTPVDQSIGPL